MKIDGEVRGLKETVANVSAISADLHGPPMADGMRQATLLVTRSAKEYAPVDTNRLRSSITPEVRSFGTETQGVVGSNVVYAPFQELGTKPHWPPLAALEAWARHHGTTAFVVARAIAQRGTKAIRFLERGLTDNSEAIRDLLDNVTSQIVKR